MGRLIYLMNTSLDGYVEGPDGRFDWSVPDEEIHSFHNDQARSMAAFLYGRRLYETMKVWEDFGNDPSLPDYVKEYARIWRQKPKIVFSTSLAQVAKGHRLVRGDPAAELARLRHEEDGDLGVGGPGLASAFARLGLIDEYRLVLSPVLLGGGKAYAPALDPPIRLKLLETRTFASGAVYLRYQKAQALPPDAAPGPRRPASTEIAQSS